ncbi:MAG: sugar nucleotide-binding protein [Pseudomonadota bacterium]|nr:sugar nucleotide-binding protein [Pseudomonadota bacterium]
MDVLIVGAAGQLGTELHTSAKSRGYNTTAVDRNELDITNEANVTALVARLKPTVIINAAAYTAVDKAESDAELAHAVNGVAPGVLAEEAKLLNAALVHYSTDYVFDGLKGAPY